MRSHHELLQMVEDGRGQRERRQHRDLGRGPGALDRERQRAANAAGCALNVDGLGAVGLRAQSGVALPANYLSAGAVYVATYINATTEWLLWGAGSDASALN